MFLRQHCESGANQKYKQIHNTDGKPIFERSGKEISNNFLLTAPGGTRVIVIVMVMYDKTPDK
jgi:hypothetical protein